MQNGRLCGVCEKPLVNNQQKYCSRVCGAKGTKSWTYVKRDERRTWDCVICGVKHYRQNSPYCSAEHKLEGRTSQIVALLVEGSSKVKTLRYPLLKYGILEAKCAWCGLTEWRGKSGIDAPLQLDHINGRAADNRLENLRILCANCHMQTDTYCGRNKGNGTRGSR